MGNSFAIGIRSALGAISAALVFVGMGVSLSGCPVAAELENEDRFLALAGSGNSGTSGAAGSGGIDCNQPLPDGPGTAGIMCDYMDAMRDHCARGGCHNAATKSAQLDLTLDTLLIARILEVPSKHASLTCPGSVRCDPAVVPPACDNCSMCVPGDLLLTKANIAGSWLLRKMEAFNVDMPSTVVQMQCGTAMPYPPGNTGFTADRRTCLTNFFTWVANNGRKCDVAVGGSGSGGSASGGAGGAGAAGAGSGGGGAGGT